MNFGNWDSYDNMHDLWLEKLREYKARVPEVSMTLINELEEIDIMEDKITDNSKFEININFEYILFVHPVGVLLT